MKQLKFLITGILFGIVLTKSELISWYRWQEAFLLDGFQIYGIFFTSVAVGIGVVYWIKRSNMKDVEGNFIVFMPKKKSFVRYLAGGLIFGAGWALVGCPGAQYALLGQGFLSIVIVLMSAVFGTFVYGMMRNRLPH